MSNFWIFANLVGEKRYLNVVLICISIMSKTKLFPYGKETFALVFLKLIFLSLARFLELSFSSLFLNVYHTLGIVPLYLCSNLQIFFPILSFMFLFYLSCLGVGCWFCMQQLYFYWSVVNLQCVSFKCTTKWFSYTCICIYMHSFSYSFPL